VELSRDVLVAIKDVAQEISSHVPLEGVQKTHFNKTLTDKLTHLAKELLKQISKGKPGSTQS